MSDIQLKLEVRGERKKQNAALRKSGYIPVVLYGHGFENQHLKVRGQDFLKVFQTAGQSALIEFILPSQASVKGLIQDVQIDPVSRNFLHVDFHQVRMDEAIHTEIPIEFIGISPAVKELGGTLVKSLEHVDVECLPDALVSELKVDISPLKTFDDQMTVRDLPHPKGLKFLNDEHEVIALVAEPQKVEEPEKTEAEPATTIAGAEQQEASPPSAPQASSEKPGEGKKKKDQ